LLFQKAPLKALSRRAPAAVIGEKCPAEDALGALPLQQRSEPDLASQPSFDESELREQASLAFLKLAENVLILGAPGNGNNQHGVALGTIDAS
jgi:hypothetical protein